MVNNNLSHDYFGGCFSIPNFKCDIILNKKSCKEFTKEKKIFGMSAAKDKRKLFFLIKFLLHSSFRRLR